ncbi:ribonuclease HIII [Mycoplasma leonicaptivi]|uniref:ribonuclease HIII n=1 Tax=Mycoplasma leonicaptivi TaxID=36742 RepID=UPI0006866426|nr:ribonuclease HIII [Mycoplasma leonicaptivi]
MKHLFGFNQITKDSNILGIDETGVGDYFTPLVSCIVFIPQQSKDFLKSLNIKDSKKLSEKEINKIAKQLINNVFYACYNLSQSGYNSLINKNFNANEVKYICHLNAIEKFVAKYDNFFEQNTKTTVFIDQYSTEKSILKYATRMQEQKYFDKLNRLSNVNLVFDFKAEDKEISVACASIIARYTLNKLMLKQQEEWNFPFMFGASAQVKKQVQEFKEKFGEAVLFKVCKMNFKI